MAESSFDRMGYFARLATRWMGRVLAVRSEATSTNDLAWEALPAGAVDGFAVVADAQHRGRGRAGRTWHTAPGKGLALSVLLVDRGQRPLGVLPLASGLALARAFDALGAPARLKWPNDLLLEARKVAGILVETRGLTAHGAERRRGERGPEGRATVIGVGVNVSQRESDFPPEYGAHATSLAIEGFPLSREIVAAEFLNALEPLWDVLAEQGAEPILAGWTERASFWGEEVCARTPSGTVTGIARALDLDGGLVIEQSDGRRVKILAGDVVPVEAAPPARR